MPERRIFLNIKADGTHSNHQTLDYSGQSILGSILTAPGKKKKKKCPGSHVSDQKTLWAVEDKSGTLAR
jgi:hypothetical protein